MEDAFGNDTSVSSAQAIAEYDRAMDRQLRAWPGVLQAADAALAHAPDFALAHALRAMALGAYAQGAAAREALAYARTNLERLTPRERSHVTLVAEIVEGRTREALAHVIEHARAWPTDVLAASTALGAYGLFAFSGRADHETARVAFTEALVPHLPADLAWLHAYRGWALIEAGDPTTGLSMARRSLELQPDSGYTAHIVLHGFFELHDAPGALAFAESWLPRYPDDALMWGHLNWHAALAEMALGRAPDAARRLLGPIVAYLPRGTPFMGLADIASLSWRLGLAGGHDLPWDVASAHAARHYAGGSNVFGELHLAMIAAARGEHAALQACATRLRMTAEHGHEGAVVALHWVDGLAALLAGDAEQAREQLDACVDGAVRLGGSRAQREIVALTRDAMRVPRVS